MPDGMFAGRDAERDQLRAALTRARTGNGSTFLIAGESGIGKSRLAHVFATEAAAHGARVLTGQGIEGPWSKPYAIWADPLAHASGDATLSADQARALLPIVPDLAARASGSDHIQLEPDQERMRVFDAVQQVLGALAARQALVIVLDDVQWADAVSLELVRHLAWFTPRAGIVLVACERTGEPDRPAETAAHLDRLRTDSWVNNISLRGLPADAIARMIGDRVKIDRHIVETLTAQTSGNPFFVEELIRSGADSPDAAMTRDLVDVDVPATIRLAIERRLARLHPNTRALLSAVALFPTGAEFRVLQAVTDLGDDQLLNALDEALASQILIALPGSAERYTFAHAIVRQSLADDWNPSRRVRLHVRAAEAMEQARGGQLDEHAAEIAVQYHHARSLPEAERGLPYAIAAVEQARRAQSAGQTMAFLRIARDLASGADALTRADLLGQLAIAEAEAVQVEAATATLEAFLLEAERAGSDRLLVAGHLNDLARALKYSAYAEERHWRPVVERGLARSSPDDGLIWARLMLLLDPVEPLSRSGIKAGRWLGFDERATAILRSEGDEDDYARSVESFDAFSRAETDAYLTRIRGFSSASAIMYGLTVAANHLQYRHGAFRDAHRLWLEMLERSERAGAIHWEQQATNQLTYLLIADGRFAEAAGFEDRSNELAARLGPGQHSEGHQLEMATCRAIYQGTNWQEIAQTWRSMVDDPGLGPHDLATLTGAFYGALAAYCAAQADDHVTALRLLELLEPILAKMAPLDCNHNGAVAFAAGTAWKLNQSASAPMYRQLAEELIEARIGDYPQSSIHLAYGQSLALLGRIDDARAAFAMARRTVAESGQAPMTPIVDFIEAEALCRTGSPGSPDVVPLLNRAREGFDQFGMTPWQIDHQILTDELSASTGKGPGLPGGITEREADVLRLIARGYSDRQVSDDLFISPRTVNAHVRNMLGKTGAANRVELAMWARSNGIVPG